MSDDRPDGVPGESAQGVDDGDGRPEQRADEREGGAAQRTQTRRRADALGDVVPEGAGDESSSGWGDRDRVPDEDYLRDVPPHHG